LPQGKAQLKLLSNTDCRLILIRLSRRGPRCQYSFLR
jgi:hypothetical protein